MWRRNNGDYGGERAVRAVRLMICQAIFRRRRHQPRRPALAKIRPEIQILQLAQERKRVPSQQSVVIEPGASLIHASMRAALAELDEGTFTEGLELDLNGNCFNLFGEKWRA